MNSSDIAHTMKKLPNRNDHNCFGCSPVNETGLKMEFSTDGSGVYSDLIIPDHLCGWNNLAHGGIISTILDEVMSWGAIYLLRKIIFTKSMTVDFLNPILISTEIKAESTVLERISDREAIMQGVIYNDKGIPAARSRGTFALFTPEVIRRKGLLGEKEIQYFEMMLNG